LSNSGTLVNLVKFDKSNCSIVELSNHFERSIRGILPRDDKLLTFTKVG
jgi:hypothetical protein